jgi:hypothetical protein
MVLVVIYRWVCLEWHCVSEKLFARYGNSPSYSAVARLAKVLFDCLYERPRAALPLAPP